jgi:hypothetical protein
MPPSIASGSMIPDSPVFRGPHPWRTLAAQSYRDDVRHEIRRALRAGLIRVQPCPRDPERVGIVPVPADDQQPELSSPVRAPVDRRVVGATSCSVR